MFEFSNTLFFNLKDFDLIKMASSFYDNDFYYIEKYWINTHFNKKLNLNDPMDHELWRYIIFFPNNYEK